VCDERFEKSHRLQRENDRRVDKPRAGMTGTQRSYMGTGIPRNHSLCLGGLRAWWGESLLSCAALDSATTTLLWTLPVVEAISLTKEDRPLAKVGPSCAGGTSWSDRVPDRKERHAASCLFSRSRAHTVRWLSLFPGATLWSDLVLRACAR
jgi:hypothetical protein